MASNTINLNPMMARFQNEACLVDASSRPWFESCVHHAGVIMGRIDASTDQPQMSDDFWFDESDWRAAYRPYVVKDGILQIPVKGVLLNDFGYALGSWATGYQYIWRAFERGMGDQNVRGIALVCDTPGGMVAGNFELVDKMFAKRGTKPIRGFAHESAYSAGYSIISVSDPGQITVSRTGGVGSIGVVTSHVDVSGAMEQGGYKLTFIHAGKHKVDGNAYEALPAEVKARIQARVDDLYSIFVSTVARNRDMDQQAVRDTEALTFSAPEALTIGLADRIGSFDDALADFSASLNPDEGNETMSEKTFTQADIDSAVATATTAATASQDAAVATARTEGATAERARINGILASDEGKARPVAALSAALNTDLALETATTFLGSLPEEKAEAAPAANTTAGAPKGMLDSAMDNTNNPNIDSASGDDVSDDALMINDSFGGKKPAARAA